MVYNPQFLGRFVCLLPVRKIMSLAKCPHFAFLLVKSRKISKRTTSPRQNPPCQVWWLLAISGSSGISVLFRACCRNASNSLNGHISKRIGAFTCICFYCGVRRNGIDFCFQYLPDVILCSCRVSDYPALMAEPCHCVSLGRLSCRCMERKIKDRQVWFYSQKIFVGIFLIWKIR